MILLTPLTNINYLLQFASVFEDIPPIGVMFEIAGKVALVTGGASGIGLAIAKAMLANGFKAVAIIDINEENGRIALQNIREEFGGDRAMFIKTNIADKNQFDQAFRSVVGRYQNLDVVINCAGTAMDAEWETAIAINLTGTTTGTILAVETYLPKYKSGDDSVVVNISSLAGINGNAFVPVYSATKSGIIGLTRSFGTAFHYARKKVRVLSVCPGDTNTPMLHEDNSFCFDFEDVSNVDFNVGAAQQVGYAANAVIHVIKEGENGSVWISEAQKPPYEIRFLKHVEMKK